MFSIPTKEIIINDDAQVRLLEDDGTVYLALDTTPTTGGFILEGFLSLVMATQVVLLAAATRIRKVVASAGVAAIRSYTIVAASSPANAAFRIVYESLDLTPVEFQNQAQEKRYQISAAQSSAANIATKMIAVINNDKYAPVVASSGGAGVVTLTAKTVGVKFEIYSPDFAIPAAGGITAPALPINTYDYLKNINWAKNVDFDRNLNWNPLPGILYDSYYFEVDGTVPVPTGQTVPTNALVSSRNAFKLYVKQGTTLATKLNLLVTDLNA